MMATNGANPLSAERFAAMSSFDAVVEEVDAEVGDVEVREVVVSVTSMRLFESSRARASAWKGRVE
jgi:hypothetical protein